VTERHGAQGSLESRLLQAQADRLLVVAEFLNLAVSIAGDPRDRTIDSLETIVKRLYASGNNSELWLTLCALSGAFPRETDMVKAINCRDTETPENFCVWIISASALAAMSSGATELPMRIIERAVFVDVSSCARYDRQTGIQRVERETMPFWHRDHGEQLHFVAWSDRDGIYRSLREKELRRVIGWGTHSETGPSESDEGLEFLVPWESTIVLPEVSNFHQSQRLRAIAMHTSCRISAIGYDLIPMISPELLPRDSGSDFLEYVSVIKSASVIAGISESASEEFRGLLDGAQSSVKHDVQVTTCQLPASVPSKEMLAASPASGETMVLCVGSHEPRKNHGTVLHAAEVLWREGFVFSLWFLGGGGWGTDFDGHVRRLKKAGRKIELRKSVTEATLWDAYRRASFTVFPSLHEGYGLPVAESIAFGTPVITSNYGSTREVAEHGGCLLVDPRSDSEVLEAMRRLLTDKDLHTRLANQARTAPSRSWGEYAEELWGALVAGSI
jgi:glycosyltransferase involved in cell wall biosynthesis